MAAMFSHLQSEIIPSSSDDAVYNYVLSLTHRRSDCTKTNKKVENSKNGMDVAYTLWSPLVRTKDGRNKQTGFTEV